MLRTIKKFWWLALLVAGVPAAWGYAIIGPNANGGDSWQTQALGFNPQSTIDPASTGPKNIGEEYRQNKGTLYFAYDASFLNFFGTSSNGVAPADQAFAILNAVFSNSITGPNGLDGYSPSLEEFPLNSQHMNYTALGLGLTDVKSLTLWALVEQMGLAWPERYVWVLHQAFLPTGLNPPASCPDDEEFEVVQRNYPVEDSVVVPLQNNPFINTIYSPYVNDTLYTFQIFYWPNCTRPGSSRAQYDFLAEPVAVDPFADSFTSVAGTSDLLPGGFYTGLTRDDVAGLRYLMTANNRNFETPAPGSTVQTATVSQVLVTSSDLNALLTFAPTNAPTLIPGSFPGVVVANSTSSYAVVCTTNLVASIPIQNFAAPYPANFGALSLTTVVNCDYQQVYVTTFANVITNASLTNNPGISLASTNIVLNYSSNTVVTTLITSLTPALGQPYPPSPVTNVNVAVSTTLNVPSGEYLILPAGACGYRILSAIALPPVLTTNLISSATNANGFLDTVSTVTSFTPHRFLIQQTNCATVAPSAGLYEGIQKIQFARADFDSLLGQFFRPVTNNYTMTIITNSQTVVQNFQRVVTAPDILLSANDEPLTTSLPTYNAFSRSITFNQANILPNLAGPGTVTSPATFTFNKAGNLFLNGSMSSFGITTNSLLPYLNELTRSPIGVIWASFDSSTNDPVIYPNGTSIQNLVNQMLIQVTPPAGILPDGTNGIAYTNITFTATGGAFSPPYTWSLGNGTVLPQGLSLTSASSVGTLSGTPQNNPPGTFDFTILLTDSIGRSVTWNYQITIH